MSKSRKDPKGRALRKGESYRACDARYVYRYTDALGRSIAVYANTLLDLREKEKQILHDEMDGLNIYLSKAATLNFVFDRYISTKQDIKEQTRVSYQYYYDHFIRNTFGKRRIVDICYSDVKAFYLSLLNENGIQPATLSSIHTILHPTFTMAVRDNIIRNNPSDNVIREISRIAGKNKGVRHALTLDQQRAFLHYTENDPEYAHWLPLFVVLFGTGLRIGEMIGLRWDDVDLEKRLIDVNHAVVYRMMESGKMELHVTTPKTKTGIRIIPMLDQVYEALMNERNYQNETGLMNAEVVDGMSGFIFFNRNGEIHKPGMINAAIRRIYRAYNAEEQIRAKRERREAVLIPHFSCHHIRHTFCTRLCEQETNLKVIQDIMGHANIETTMDIYAEATTAKKQEAISELQKKVNLF